MYDRYTKQQCRVCVFMLPWGHNHSGRKCQNSIGYIAAEEKDEHELGLLPSRHECMVELYD